VLRTPPLPAAHDRAGPGREHAPGTTRPTSSASNPRVHSHSATSCRNGICGRSWPSTRPTPTDGDPIAAASSTHTGPTTLSPASPRSGFQTPARPRRPHQRIRARRI